MEGGPPTPPDPMRGFEPPEGFAQQAANVVSDLLTGVDSGWGETEIEWTPKHEPSVPEEVGTTGVDSSGYDLPTALQRIRELEDHLEAATREKVADKAVRLLEERLAEAESACQEFRRKEAERAGELAAVQRQLEMKTREMAAQQDTHVFDLQTLQDKLGMVEAECARYKDLASDLQLRGDNEESGWGADDGIGGDELRDRVEELERMLEDGNRESKARIEELEAEVQKATQVIDLLREQLAKGGDREPEESSRIAELEAENKRLSDELQSLGEEVDTLNQALEDVLSQNHEKDEELARLSRMLSGEENTAQLIHENRELLARVAALEEGRPMQDHNQEDQHLVHAVDTLRKEMATLSEETSLLRKEREKLEKAAVEREEELVRIRSEYEALKAEVEARPHRVPDAVLDSAKQETGSSSGGDGWGWDDTEDAESTPKPAVADKSLVVEDTDMQKEDPLDEQIKCLHADLEMEREKVGKHMETIRELESAVGGKQGQLEFLEREVATQLARTEMLEADLIKEREKNKEAEEQIEKLAAQLESLTTSNDSVTAKLRIELDEMQAEKAALLQSATEGERMAGELARAQQDLDEVRKQREELQNELARTSERLASLQAEHDEHGQTVWEAEEELGDLRDQLSRLREDLAKSHEEIAQLKAEASEATAQAQRAEELLADTKCSNDLLQAQLAEATAGLAELRSKLEEAERTAQQRELDETALLEMKDRLEEVVREKCTRLAEEEDKANEAEQQAAAAERARDAAEARIATLEAEVAKLRAGQETLVAQLEGNKAKPEQKPQLPSPTLQEEEHGWNIDGMDDDDDSQSQLSQMQAELEETRKKCEELGAHVAEVGESKERLENELVEVNRQKLEAQEKCAQLRRLVGELDRKGQELHDTAEAARKQCDDFAQASEGLWLGFRRGSEGDEDKLARIVAEKERECTKLQEEVSSLSAKLDEATTEVTAHMELSKKLRGDVVSLEEKLRTVSARHAEELEALRAQLADEGEKVIRDKLEHSVQEGEAKLRSVLDELSSSKDEVRHLQQRLQETAEGAQEEIRALEEQLRSSEAAKEEAEAELSRKVQQAAITEHSLREELQRVKEYVEELEGARSGGCQELADMVALLEQAKQDGAAAREEVLALKEQLDEKTAAHSKLEESFAKQKAELHTVKTKGGAALKDMRAKMAAQEAALKEYQAKRDSVEGDSSKLKEEIASLRAECDRLENGQRAAAEDRATLQRLLQESEEKVRESEEKVKECEEKVRESEEKVRESEEKVRESEEKVGECEEKMRESEERQRDLQRRVDELVRAAEDAERERDVFESRYQELLAATEQTEQEMDDVRRLASEKEAQQSALEKQVAELITERDSLEQRRVELEEEVSRVSQQLASEREARETLEVEHRQVLERVTAEEPQVDVNTQSELEAAREELTALQGKYKSKVEEMNKVKKAAQELNARYKETVKSSEALKKELDRAKEASASGEQTIAMLQQELEVLRTKGGDAEERGKLWAEKEESLLQEIAEKNRALNASKEEREKLEAEWAGKVSAVEEELVAKEREWTEKVGELNQAKSQWDEELEQWRRKCTEMELEAARKEGEWSEKEREWDRKEREWDEKEWEWDEKEQQWGEKAREKEQEWVEKVQQWVEKEQEWVEKEREWVGKEQQWVEKEQQWVEKEQEWVEKEQQWVEKEREWVEKEQQWVEKEREWVEGLARTSGSEHEEDELKWASKVEALTKRVTELEAQEAAWAAARNEWERKEAEWIERTERKESEKEEGWGGWEEPDLREEGEVGSSKETELLAALEECRSREAVKEQEWEGKRKEWEEEKQRWLEQEERWRVQEEDWGRKEEEWGEREREWQRKEKEWSDRLEGAAGGRGEEGKTGTEVTLQGLRDQLEQATGVADGNESDGTKDDGQEQGWGIDIEVSAEGSPHGVDGKERSVAAMSHSTASQAVQESVEEARRNLQLLTPTTSIEREFPIPEESVHELRDRLEEALSDRVRLQGMVNELSRKEQALQETLQEALQQQEKYREELEERLLRTRPMSPGKDAALVAARDKLSAMVAQLGSELEVKKAALEKAASELQEAHERGAVLEDKVGRLEVRARQAEEKLIDVDTELTAARAELAELEGAGSELQALREQLTAKEGDLEREKEVASAAQRTAEELREQIALLEAAAQKGGAAEEEEEVDLSEDSVPDNPFASSEEKDRRKRKAAPSMKIAQLEAALREAQEEAAKAKELVAQQQQLDVVLNNPFATEEEKEAAMQQKRAAAEQEKGELVARVNELVLEQGSYAKKLDEAQELADKYRKEAYDLREELQAVSESLAKLESKHSLDSKKVDEVEMLMDEVKDARDETMAAEKRCEALQSALDERVEECNMLKELLRQLEVAESEAVKLIEELEHNAPAHDNESEFEIRSESDSVSRLKEEKAALSTSLDSKQADLASALGEIKALTQERDEALAQLDKARQDLVRFQRSVPTNGTPSASEGQAEGDEPSDGEEITSASSVDEIPAARSGKGLEAALGELRATLQVGNQEVNDSLEEVAGQFEALEENMTSYEGDPTPFQSRYSGGYGYDALTEDTVSEDQDCHFECLGKLETELAQMKNDLILSAHKEDHGLTDGEMELSTDDDLDDNRVCRRLEVRDPDLPESTCETCATLQEEIRSLREAAEVCTAEISRQAHLKRQLEMQHAEDLKERDATIQAHLTSIATHKDAASQLEEEAKQLREQISAKDGTAQRLIEDLQRQVTDLKSRIPPPTDELASASRDKELAQLQERCSQLEEQVASGERSAAHEQELQEELARATQKYTECQSDLHDANEKCNSLQRELREVGEKCGNLQQELDVMISARNDEEKWAALQQELEAANNRSAALQHDLEAANTRCSELQEAAETAKQELAVATTKCTALEDEANETREVLITLRREVEQLQEALDLANKKCYEAVLQHDTYQTQSATEIESLRSQLDEATKQCEQLSAEMEKAVEESAKEARRELDTVREEMSKEAADLEAKLTDQHTAEREELNRKLSVAAEEAKCLEDLLAKERAETQMRTDRIDALEKQVADLTVLEHEAARADEELRTSRAAFEERVHELEHELSCTKERENSLIEQVRVLVEKDESSRKEVQSLQAALDATQREWEERIQQKQSLLDAKAAEAKEAWDRVMLLETAQAEVSDQSFDIQKRTAELESLLAHEKMLVSRAEEDLSNKDGELRETNLRLAETSRELEVALDQKDNLNTLLAAERETTDSLREDIQQLELQIAEQKQELQSIMEELKVESQRAEHLKLELEEGKAENADHQDATQQDGGPLQQSLIETRAKLAEMQSELAVAVEELDEKIDELNEMTAARDELSQQVENLQREQGEAMATIQHLQGLLEVEKSGRDALESRIAGQQGKSKEVDAALLQAKEEARAAGSEIESLKLALQALEARKAAAEEEAEQALEAKNQQHDSLTAAQERLKQLERDNEDLRGQVKHLQRRMADEEEDFASRLAAAEDRVAVLEVSLASAKRDLVTAEARCEELSSAARATQMELESEVETLQQDCKAKARAIEEAERLRERMKALEQESTHSCEMRDEANKDLQRQLSLLREDKAAAEAELDTLRERLNQQEEEVEKLRSQIRRQLTESEALQADMTSLRHRAEEAEQRVQISNRKAAEAVREKQSLGERVRALSSEVETLKEQSARMEKLKDEAERQVRRLSSDLAKAERCCEEQKDMEELEDVIASMKESHAKEVERLNIEIRELTNRCTDLEGDANAVVEDLRKADKCMVELETRNHSLEEEVQHLRGKVAQLGSESPQYDDFETSDSDLDNGHTPSRRDSVAGKAWRDLLAEEEERLERLTDDVQAAVDGQMKFADGLRKVSSELHTAISHTMARLPSHSRMNKGTRQKSQLHKKILRELSDEVVQVDRVLKLAEMSAAQCQQRVENCVAPYRAAFLAHVRALKGVTSPWKDPIGRALVQIHRGKWCAATEALAVRLRSETEALRSLKAAIEVWRGIDLSDRKNVVSRADNISQQSSAGEDCELLPGLSALASELVEASHSDTVWPPTGGETEDLASLQEECQRLRMQLADYTQQLDEQREDYLLVKQQHLSSPTSEGKDTSRRENEKLRGEIRRLHLQLKSLRNERGNMSSDTSFGEPGVSIEIVRSYVSHLYLLDAKCCFLLDVKDTLSSALEVVSTPPPSLRPYRRFRAAALAVISSLRLRWHASAKREGLDQVARASPAKLLKAFEGPHKVVTPPLKTQRSWHSGASAPEREVDIVFDENMVQGLQELKKTISASKAQLDAIESDSESGDMSPPMPGTSGHQLAPDTPDSSTSSES